MNALITPEVPFKPDFYSYPVEVKMTKTMGLGLFATRDVPRGYPLNQHRKSTADPQLMSQNFPKFSYPYGGRLKILPKFRKVLRKFQQQIKSTANQQSNQVTRLFLAHQHCKW